MTYVVRICISRSASDREIADFADLRLILITFASLTISSFPCHRDCMRLELFYRRGTRGVSVEDLSASPRARYEVPTFWTLRRNSIPRCWISTIFIRYRLTLLSSSFISVSVDDCPLHQQQALNIWDLLFYVVTWRIRTLLYT